VTTAENENLKSAPTHWDEAYDVVVLGGGAAGLTAAIVSAIEGRRALLIEKSDQIGGTSALSSGTAWIPNNAYQRRNGITGDAKAALAYLDALVGDRSEPGLRKAFITAGPDMLAYLEQHIDLRWLMYDVQPDYDQKLPGATTMMITRGEAARLLRIGRNLDSFLLGAKLCGRYILDRMRYLRGTRLVLGNALVAHLFKNLRDRQTTIWYNAKTTRLILHDGRACGLVVQRDSAELRLRANHGIVLAGGGFPASPELRERYFPKPVARHTSAYEGCTGDTLLLAQQIGASLGSPGEDNALWFPSSITTRKDGSTAVFPHIVLDRAKPGLIAVNSAGRRFCDEASSYHEFVRRMYRSNRDVPSIPAWLISDRRFVWKYGIGMISPLTPFLKPFVKRGYLRIADSVEELARSIGVDAGGLVQTVRTHNEFARTGVDIDFGKGSNAYDRAYGDPEHLPNPCLGPIERPPYCAVAILPTPLGTSLGLLTNAHAQVLKRSGHPIEGLYACGNDMQNIFGGEYPGPGAQIGVGMAFGYLAAKHAVGTG
jgi:succinate dehydrogenase/fumarate reductase flavoprotein subunit